MCTIEVRAAELFDHAAGVLDVSNIEAVHAMRVATRRLRSVLEFYEPCLDRDKLKPVLRQVCDLADALGQRRDPDVELEALAQFAAAATPSALIAGCRSYVATAGDGIRMRSSPGYGVSRPPFRKKVT